MRALLLAALASLVLSGAALADPVIVHDGRFEADVSARDITRIAIAGEKVATVRKIDDAQAPKMSVDVDAATGDVFVNFDGDVVGRSFTVFLTTQNGRTVEAILSPRDRDGQTILVRLDHETSAAIAAPPGAGEGAAGEGDSADPGPTAPADPHAARHEGYPEILTALIRLMFNQAAAPGVDRITVSEAPRPAGAFQLQVVETYAVGDLKGTVLSLRNTSPVGQAVNAKTFLAPSVLAAAVSHETVQPGQYARVYIVEGAPAADGVRP